MNRRDLLALGFARSLPGSGAPRFIKGLCTSVFPPGTPFQTCVDRAAAAGFEALEIRLDAHEFLSPQATTAEAARLGEIAQARHLQIASLWVLTPSSPSLASPDVAERRDAMSRVEAAIRLAPSLGAHALLVTPAVLGRGPRMRLTHDQAWEAATAAYRQLLPGAEKAGLLLTPENVWNRFLVSPRDMRSFVDQFHSKAIGVHFDTGNVLQFGYPEDWILTLGSRIRRVHFKDFQLAKGGREGHFVPLLEGDVNWQAVMACLTKTGYRGFVSAEAGPDPSDPDQLNKLSRAMDRILALA